MIWAISAIAVAGLAVAVWLLLFKPLPDPPPAPAAADGPQPLLVDVRKPVEFVKDRLEGAVNIPLDDMQHHMGRFGPQGTPIRLYCCSGRRSKIALGKLRREGFTDVVDLGGINAAVAAGWPRARR
ncbi:MAG: rhodanese-like domain-containing protein [Myxococcales bacterium]|nr:rhodanese-like domain-containing protein [Myxococcales bacterium]MCB9523937.1 rhodanese-like domain-containing protein [Myxococcales bacterium]